MNRRVALILACLSGTLALEAQGQGLVLFGTHGEKMEYAVADRVEELGFKIDVSQIRTETQIRIQVPPEIEGFPYLRANARLEGSEATFVLSFRLETLTDASNGTQYVQLTGSKDVLACIQVNAEYQDAGPGYTVGFYLYHYVDEEEPECMVGRIEDWLTSQ